MAERALKRQRADSNGTAVKADNTYSHLATAISELPEDTVRQLLASAAASHADVANSVRTTVGLIRTAQSRKSVDFDHYSKSAWKVLNVKYSRLSGSHQSDASGDAYHAVIECIENIQRECPTFASFATKKNALEVCRKIGKTICLSGDVIGREARGLFQSDDTLERTMAAIAESLTSAERKAVLTDEWYDKLDELINLAGESCIFENLELVLNVLEEEEHEDAEPDEDEDVDREEAEEEDGEEGDDGEEDQEEEKEWAWN